MPYSGLRKAPITRRRFVFPTVRGSVWILGYALTCRSPKRRRLGVGPRRRRLGNGETGRAAVVEGIHFELLGGGVEPLLEFRELGRILGGQVGRLAEILVEVVQLPLV